MSFDNTYKEVNLMQGVSLEASKSLFGEYGDLLTMEDCAEITHQTAQTVRALCREKVLPSARIGRRLYVPKALLIDYIQSQIAGE